MYFFIVVTTKNIRKMTTTTWMILGVGVYVAAMSLLFMWVMNDFADKCSERFRHIFNQIDAIKNTQTTMQDTISKTDIKSAFCHQLFMKTVKRHYQIYFPRDQQIQAYVKSVSTGIPVSTNIFIILCNEMGISPINFFKTRK